jgi:hypothetical protein
MDKVFKVSGREDVLGRLRNIYIRMTKKAGVAQQGKTKYIKCKGEFVRLTTYIKENARANAANAANAASAAGKTVKISKRVSVIANISKIKDIRTRRLLEKTFKKNAKLYFIKDNKRWKGSDGGSGGGGLTYEGGMYRTGRARGHSRERSRERSTGRATGRATRRATRRSTSRERDYRRNVMRNRDQPVNRRTEGSSIDRLSIQLHEQEHVIFDKICNIEYVFRGAIRIRPYIKFEQNKKMFIKFYWSYEGWLHNGVREWFEMPLHISNFTEIMNGNLSGHIHITSEATELLKYNIGVRDNLEADGVAGRTHTYLRAENIRQVIQILRTHGMDIFSDWYYAGFSAAAAAADRLRTYFTTTDGGWIRHTNGNYRLNEEEQRGLCFCINNFSFILADMFNDIEAGYLEEGNVRMNDGNITRRYINEYDRYAHIDYKYSELQSEWTPFSDQPARMLPTASTRFRY